MNKPMPKDEEIVLDPKRYIISRTDPKGIITYANAYFAKICGYSVDELIGSPHNIIRHPDMPKVIFKMMWGRIKRGQNMMAVVKNLAKDGRYYWVITDFEPKIDKLTGEIIQHTAYRKAAPRNVVKEVIELYKNLCDLERFGDMRESEAFFNKFLNDKGITYDEWIDKVVENKGLLKLFFAAMKKMF